MLNSDLDNNLSSKDEAQKTSDTKLLDADLDQKKLKDFFGPNYSKLESFHKLLVDEGDLRGLIGPRELPKLWIRHILNSAAVGQYIFENAGEITNIVDIGSGAGFPGIVLACMFPDSHFFLVDSMQRRTDWLEYAAKQIELTNVTVIRGRAEEICQNGEIPLCDYSTARAVASLKKLLPWTMPFLKPGGQLLALKGENVSNELVEAKKQLKRFGKGEPEILTAHTLSGVGETTIFKLSRR
jgi:16S rRNA (guanine527-N7)-methyltransferase